MAKTKETVISYRVPGFDKRTSKREEESEEVLKKYKTSHKTVSLKDQIKLEEKRLKELKRRKDVPLEIVKRLERIIQYKEREI